MELRLDQVHVAGCVKGSLGVVLWEGFLDRFGRRDGMSEFIDRSLDHWSSVNMKGRAEKSTSYRRRQ
jgi:hypothetical protein